MKTTAYKITLTPNSNSMIISIDLSHDAEHLAWIAKEMKHDYREIISEAKANGLTLSRQDIIDDLVAEGYDEPMVLDFINRKRK